jgi:hypothetical protein
MCTSFIWLVSILRNPLERNNAELVAARSTQYAEQARTATNVFARKTFEYFEEDWNLTERFHSMLDRKWDQ